MVEMFDVTGGPVVELVRFGLIAADFQIAVDIPIGIGSN